MWERSARVVLWWGVAEFPRRPCIPVSSYHVSTQTSEGSRRSPTPPHCTGIGAKDPGFDADGRRPAPYRDALEDLIVGSWEWREGEVSGVPRGRPVRSGSGRDGMLYNFGRRGKRKRGEDDHGGVSLSTGVTVKDQFVRWGKDVPQTRVLAHTPG